MNRHTQTASPHSAEACPLPDAASLISHFALQAHPEGGFYRRTYHSAETIAPSALPPRFSGERYFSTGILFLLRGGDYSHLHKIQQDEMWHFYLGGPLRLVIVSPEGLVREHILGQNIFAGEYVQYVVPAGHWFGASPCTGTAFSFVGCTVAPGFDFADFTLGTRADLLRDFPQAAPYIQEFCPNSCEV